MSCAVSGVSASMDISTSKTLCAKPEADVSGPPEFFWDQIWRARLEPPSGGLIVPEFLEAIAAELGVTDGVLDVLVPEVVLDRPGVLTIVGQFEAGGMPQHVGMHGEVEAGHRPGPGHDLPERGVRQQTLPLGHEDIGRLRVLPRQLPQRADLRAAKRMGAG